MNTVDQRVRLGVSACLLGEEVRYDGGHKRDRFLTETLGGFVEWVQVCPEVEAGMGTPRPAMRLVRAPGGSIRLITVVDGVDLTATMRTFAATRAKQLAAMDLDGYVLKKDSPSCGLERVRVYAESGPPARNGRGLFGLWKSLEAQGKENQHDAAAVKAQYEKAWRSADTKLTVEDL